MHNEDFPSRSVVAPVGTERNPNGAADDRASAQIRLAREILADLLLKDEFACSGNLLVGPVAENLNELLIKLDQLAGLQKLFELWIGETEPAIVLRPK